MADPASSRQEKSLGLLTSKFVSLLQDAEDGILDIKSVRSYVLYLFRTPHGSSERHVRTLVEMYPLNRLNCKFIFGHTFLIAALPIYEGAR